MSELTDKEKAIKDVYENKFGNSYEVYKEAVSINTSIRLQDVKDYLNKRDDKKSSIKKMQSIIHSYLLGHYLKLKWMLWILASRLQI